MVYGIGQSLKLEKNRKRLDNISHPSLELSTPSYIYNKLNENTDITSKILFTAETHSSEICALEKQFCHHSKRICIQPILKIHVDFNFFVDEDDQWFETPRKAITV